MPPILKCSPARLAAGMGRLLTLAGDGTLKGAYAAETGGSTFVDADG